MSIKNNDGLSGFGQKLMCLMLEKECNTPKALAIKLLESKLVTVKTRGENLFKNKENAIGSIEKKIRNHLHSEDATCLQGEFVNAYCKFFGCSADYLFGYTDVKSSDIDIRGICEKTGLSQKAVERFVQCNISEKTIHYNHGWSRILESSLYTGIIENWHMAGEQALLAAQKDVERKYLYEERKKAMRPDALDIDCDLEGVENAYKSANAAYAGILFNISTNVAGFIEYELQPAVREFSKQFEAKYKG